MNIHKNTLSELLDIEDHIQYNIPLEVKCPVCTAPNSLFLFNTKAAGIWGRCDDCRRSGMEEHWLEHLEDPSVEMDNFHYMAEKMMYKYSQHISRHKIIPEQLALLSKLNYSNIGYRTKYPFIGIAKITEFMEDLAEAAKADGIAFDTKGPMLKKYGYVIVIPIYEAKFKIVGFTIFNGCKFRDYYIKGDPRKLYYQQSTSCYDVHNVYVPNSLRDMMAFQIARTRLSKVPANMILPFRPDFNNYTPILRKFVNAKYFTFLTDKHWALQMARFIHQKFAICKIIGYEVEGPVLPFTLNDNPEYIISIEKHLKNLDMNEMLPERPIAIDDALDFVVDEDTHSIMAKRKRTMFPITEGFIHVEPTELEHEFDVHLIRHTLCMYKERVHRDVFDTAESLNAFLRAKFPPDKKAPKVLAWLEKHGILRTLLTINPITRRHYNEQKEIKNETQAKRQVNETPHSG